MLEKPLGSRRGLREAILDVLRDPLSLPIEFRGWIPRWVETAGITLPGSSIEAGTGGFAPVGAVLPYAGSTAPAGWLLADGTAVSRTGYAALYALLGTTYGVGDGSTTFNLPNLKGRVAAGKDAAQVEFDVLGETGGAKTVSLAIAELAPHTHTQDAHTHVQDAHTHVQNEHFHSLAGDIGSAANTTATGAAGRLTTGTGFTGGTDDVAATNQNTTATNQSTTATNQSTGSGTPHQNLQPYITLNHIIKT